MDYNGMDAPQFYDFERDMGEDEHGDSWFSNESFTDMQDEEDPYSPEPHSNFEGATTSAETVTATSAVSVAGSSASTTPAPRRRANMCATKEEVDSFRNGKSAASSTASLTASSNATTPATIPDLTKLKTLKTTTFSTPPNVDWNNIIRNSRRRSLRKGSSLTRSSRKAAQRARDRLLESKKTSARTLTNVSPFKLVTDARAKRVRTKSPTRLSKDGSDTKKDNPKPSSSKVVNAFSVSSKPTAASMASRNAYQSDAEKFIKFFTKTPERCRVRKAIRAQKDEKQPVSKTVLDPSMFKGPGKLPAAKKKPVTLPKSPAFALKNRKRRIVETQEEEKHEQECNSSLKTLHGGMKLPSTKSNSTRGPVAAIKSALKIGSSHPGAKEKKVTIPQPFECELRSKEMIEHKEKFIEKEHETEKAKRLFHAQPLPVNPSDGLPEKKPQRATQPKPFNLKTDVRGHHKEQEFENKLKEEKETLKKAQEFKAQPPKVLESKPFIPKPTRKPFTEFQEFHLATNDRAEAWEENEAQRAVREARQREEEEEEQRLFKIAEAETIKKMREEMVHKSKPMPTFKEPKIHGSEKPLTIPESPDWTYKPREKDTQS